MGCSSMACSMSGSLAVLDSSYVPLSNSDEKKNNTGGAPAPALPIKLQSVCTGYGSLCYGKK